MAYVLQQLLSKSAKAYPEKPAVWARGKSITYRELDERSNQVAHLLQQRGIQKGDRVGLFFPEVRGIDHQHAGRAEGGRSLCSARSAGAG